MEIVTTTDLAAWRRRAIASVNQAINAAQEYERVKPNIMAHVLQNPRLYGDTDWSMRRALENNWTLADLTRTVNFHRDMASMLWTAIAGEAAFQAYPAQMRDRYKS